MHKIADKAMDNCFVVALVWVVVVGAFDHRMVVVHNLLLALVVALALEVA